MAATSLKLPDELKRRLERLAANVQKSPHAFMVEVLTREEAADEFLLMGMRLAEGIDPSRYAGYFEAHIEQGDTLETSGLRIGVVTAIVSIRQYRIRVTGEQNHAGTASMARRRDAGLALVRLLAAIDRRFPEVAGERSVWTTGRIMLQPGDPSIVPGGAEALFQFESSDH